MPFQSAGSGFARGFSSTYMPRKQLATQIEFEGQQAEAAAQERRREAFLGNVEASKERSLNLVDRQLEILSQLAENRAPQEDLQETANLAVRALLQHSSQFDVYKEMGTALGIDPVQLAFLPDSQEFLNEHMPLVEAALEVANLRATRPGDGTQFFAKTRDGREGRFTSERVGNEFKFFLGNEEIPADQIMAPTQRTQEVSEIQVPGLTPEQTGTLLGELREIVSANEAFTQIANTLVDQTWGKPQNVGFVGGVLRALGSITAQAQAVANVTGISERWKTNEDGSIDTDYYDFGEMAGESQEVQTRLLDLVFLNLASKGQTGRAVSDTDLKLFMNATGFGTGDPVQIEAGLRAAVQDNRIAMEAAVLNRGGGALNMTHVAPQGLTEFKSRSRGSSLNVQQELDEVERLISSGNVEGAMELMDRLRDQGIGP